MGKRSTIDRQARRELRQKLVAVGAILCAITLFGLGLYLLTLMGPRLPEQERLRAEAPDLAPLRAEVQQLSEAYMGAVEADEPGPGGAEVIQRAIMLQRRVVEYSLLADEAAVASARLRELEALRDKHEGERHYVASVEAERRAREALSAGEAEAAEEAYRVAFQEQEAINLHFPGSARRSAVRLSALRDTLTELEIRPLLEASEASAQEARGHVKEGDLEAARAAMTAAIELQEQINREYRATRFASLARLQALSRELLDFDAGFEAAQVEALMAAGMKHLEVGNHEAAEDAFGQALARQRELNSTYPRSQYASLQGEARLGILRETAASAGAMAEVHKINERMMADLRARRVVSASSQVPALFRDIQGVREKYPRSELLSEALLLKARYLNSMREDFAAIQDSVYARLVDVPGHPGRQMHSTEVAQALYLRVMGNNPAAHRGADHPVETVTHREAAAFCERLGWVLGRPVRLPTPVEYEAAVGSQEGRGISAEAWTSQNSNRETQVVGSKQFNDHGFHDLLGNVSEWTNAQNPENPEEALVMGGSVRDNPVRLLSLPSAYYNRNDRNRLIGFRFIVEMEPRTEIAADNGLDPNAG